MPLLKKQNEASFLTSLRSGTIVQSLVPHHTASPVANAKNARSQIDFAPQTTTLTSKCRAGLPVGFKHFVAQPRSPSLQKLTTAGNIRSGNTTRHWPFAHDRLNRGAPDMWQGILLSSAWPGLTFCPQFYSPLYN